MYSTKTNTKVCSVYTILKHIIKNIIKTNSLSETEVADLKILSVLNVHYVNKYFGVWGYCCKL